MGYDFLNKYNARIIYSSCQLEIGKEKRETINWSVQKAEVEQILYISNKVLNAVIAADTQLIEKNSIQTIPILFGKQEFHQVFDPISDWTYCTVACTLPCKQTNGVIVIINKTNSPIFVNKGTLMGHAEPFNLNSYNVNFEVSEQEPVKEFLNQLILLGKTVHGTELGKIRSI